MDIIIEIVQALAWPVVVFACMLLFKHQLRGVFDRVQSIKWKDYVLAFGPGAPDKERPPLQLEDGFPPGRPALSPSLRSDKPATLFWIANDIMWIQDMLFRGAPASAILSGIKNVRTYLKTLNLGGSLADAELARLHKTGQAAQLPGQAEWSPDLRSHLAQQIESVKWFLAARAQEAESGFKKLRVFPQGGKKRGT
jgi:hypothetical protein